MASTYSPNLRIELIATGEQSNTWGVTTNSNLGTLIEQAISGVVSVSVTAGDVTFGLYPKYLDNGITLCISSEYIINDCLNVSSI